LVKPESATRVLVLLQGDICVDQSTIVHSTGDPPVFLPAKSGDVVVVWNAPSLVGTESTDWWMGEILWVEGRGFPRCSPCSRWQISIRVSSVG